jgi:hypothetical protein
MSWPQELPPHRHASAPKQNLHKETYTIYKLTEAVEVNTRFGKPPDPVPISDRELECRKRLRSEHDMCIVYSSKGGDVHSVLRIQRQKAYTLSPRQYWLRPGAI